MKNLTLILVVLAGLTSITAGAHTALSGSQPANEEVVTVAPDEIVLTFSADVRLLAMSLQNDAEGHQIELGALPSETRQEFAITIPTLSSGNYVVSWRVVGADTHVVSGDVHFSVAENL